MHRTYPILLKIVYEKLKRFSRMHSESLRGREGRGQSPHLHLYSVYSVLFTPIFSKSAVPLFHRVKSSQNDRKEISSQSEVIYLVPRPPAISVCISPKGTLSYLEHTRFVIRIFGFVKIFIKDMLS